MEKNKKINILFDLNHPADVNFFKHSIYKLHKKHNIKVIYRGRGSLRKIIKYELPFIESYQIGSHKKSFFSKVFFQLVRELKILKYLIKNKIDIVVCFGSTSALSSWLLKVPYLAFDDDFEYKIPFYYANIFCTQHIYPDFITFTNNKTIKYSGFKELAYLHPNHLRLNLKKLSEFNLKKNKYVFIREIKGASLNYYSKKTILDKIISSVVKRGLKIVLSIEDKSLVNKYKDDCIILEEPVSDYYSIIYNALFVISSGDTVSRESALLGVPVIFTGNRKMSVNEALLKENIMYQLDEIKLIHELINNINLSVKKSSRKRINSLIDKKWHDTNKVILDCINKFLV